MEPDCPILELLNTPDLRQYDEVDVYAVDMMVKGSHLAERVEDWNNKYTCIIYVYLNT